MPGSITFIVSFYITFKFLPFEVHSDLKSLFHCDIYMSQCHLIVKFQMPSQIFHPWILRSYLYHSLI
jgi:hypothetical protein